MNLLKKYLGFVWIVLAIAVIVFLIYGAIHNIKPNAKLDINKPLPWIIIICIFIPVAAGMAMFGWYCVQNEYDKKISKAN